MNKLFKVMVAILGGVETIFNIMLPVFVAFLLITTIELTEFNQIMITIAGHMSSFYRALKFWIK